MAWMKSPLVLAFVLCTASVSPARAADSGSVSGAVFDQSGMPVAGATVRIAGDRLPAGRSTLTDANGAYKLEYLLPGTYAVDIEKSGIGTARRSAIVEVDKDTQVDIVLGLALREELTVTAATPVIDVRSSEISFNFKSDSINSLPLERTYRGLLQLIPGVADNRSSVGPAAGGDRQDNTYLIDGANITNPLFGYISTEVNELDIVEVNIKRAGVSAEFGRTAGAVTNAVSRSGSNRLSGLGRIDWLPTGLVRTYELPDNLLAIGIKPGTYRDPLLTTTASPAVGVGGPILKDHLFFYASARYFRETKWDRVNKAGIALPDENRSGREWYGKVTGQPSGNQQINVSFRYRPNDVVNAGLTSNTAPSLGSATDNSGRVASAQWAYFMSARRSLDVRYLYMKENNEDNPVTDLGYLPPFNPRNLAAMGQYTDPTQANLVIGGSQYTNVQNYRRHEVRGTFTQFFDIGRSSHSLKAGLGYEFGEENLNRLANGWGLIVNQTLSGVPVLRARYYTNQPSQFGQGSTYSVFVQDEMTIANRTSVYAGLLIDRDEFAQHLPASGGCPSAVALSGGAAVYESAGDTCRFLRFGFGDEIQPRLGVSHQLRKSKGDKVYANWGRYYNMDQKSSSRSLAPSRIFQTQTFFDLNGAVVSTGPLASTTGKLIDPDIAPIYSDEVLAGYATPVGARTSVDVFVMYRKMNNFIEDVPTRRNGTAPDSGPYAAANLPCTRFAACAEATARRSYRAVTFEVRRQLAAKWMADVSYTWSRFEGNFDLDYSGVSVFNTSSFIQDGPGTDVQDPNRFGPLNEDRPHVFKTFASYAPTARLTASGYLRVQSGSPWNARARDWEGAVMNYLEPAGAHRNPAWTNLDLMASYRLPLTPRASLSLEARLMNVFDDQAQLSTDSQQYLDLRTVSAAPYFAPYLQPNPFFGLGSGFAPPRRFYLAAVVGF